MRVMHPSVVLAPIRSSRHQRGSSARRTLRRMFAASMVLAIVGLLLLAGSTTPTRAADDIAKDAALRSSCGTAATGAAWPARRCRSPRGVTASRSGCGVA